MTNTSENQIERQSAIKFLGVMLDENLNWRDHNNTNETKIAQNNGFLYKAVNTSLTKKV